MESLDKLVAAVHGNTGDQHLSRSAPSDRVIASKGPAVTRRKFSDLSPRQQAALLTAISVQLSLAVTAWADLFRRPASQVNGSKAKWTAIIAVNFVGPIAYFVRGRRPAPPPPPDR